MAGSPSNPEDDQSITEEELLAGIEEMAHAVDGGLRKRVEHAGTTPSQEAEEVKKKGAIPPKAAMTLLLMGLVSTLGDQQVPLWPMTVPIGVTLWSHTHC
jgi:hypothetical protein